jgi:hypothetical protein
MRVFGALILLLLAAAPTGAEEPPLLMRESRAWKGIVEVRARPKAFPGIEGGTTQTERIEFVVVTDPPKKIINVPRLDFRPREMSGEFKIDVDLKEGSGDRARKTSGQGGGGLFPKVRGYVLPSRDHCAFEVSVSPSRLTARTTMVGIHRGKLSTFRSVATSRPFLQRFKAAGRLEEGGRRASGSESFIERSGRYPRVVTVSWSLERIDPVIEGTVTDSAGKAVAGVKVLARSTNAYRIQNKMPPFLKEAETDDRGRFRIDAWTASWNLEVLGLEREGVVYSPADLFDVKIGFTETPDLEIRLEAFRLRDLPWAYLLRRHFQGDVRGFLEHIRARVPERRMRVAMVLKDEES